MNNPTTNTIIETDIDKFRPSLWNFIGQEKATSLLKAVVDQYHEDLMDGRKPRLPSFLIKGACGMGTSVLADCIADAFGMTEIRKTYGHYLGMGESMYDFYKNTENVCCHICFAQQLSSYAQWCLMKLLREGVFLYTIPFEEEMHELVWEKGIIILSATYITPIVKPLIDAVDITCDLEKYKKIDLLRILQQRIKCLNWEVPDPQLRKIINNVETPGQSLKVLQTAYRFMRGRGRGENVMTGDDVKVALTYFAKRESPAKKKEEVVPPF